MTVENIDELSRKFGKLRSFAINVAKEEEIKAGFKKIREKFGPVHILVNCAGFYSGTNLVGGDPQVWRTMIDVNVMGLSICTSEAVQIMQEEKINGQIVHINSLAGHLVLDSPGMTMYTASKFAVTALARSLRLELNRNKSNIKISVIRTVVTNFEEFLMFVFVVECKPGAS